MAPCQPTTDGTHNGQAYAATTTYVPLPAQIQPLARTMLQHVTGPNG